MLIGLLISIALAVTFLCLYIAVVQDNAGIKKDNEWLRRQQEDDRHLQTQAKAIVDTDNRVLDKDLVMEAIRANGYSPREEDDVLHFKRRNISYQIDVDRFPMVPMACDYAIDEKEYDIHLFKRAAQECTAKCVMGKVFFIDYDDGSKGIAFTIGIVEKKYGHFRDSLETYLDIIDDLHWRFHQTYESMSKSTQVAGHGSLPEYARKWEA